MTIIGFNFSKMKVEKNKALSGKINIKNNISIKDIKENELNLGKSQQKGLKFIFEFVSQYEPDIGTITLEGEVIALEDSKKVEEILKSWKKDKKIPVDIMTDVLNTALSKSNIQALILSQQVNLPPPIPMPKVEAKTS
jgi:hypothetical protein